MTIQKFLGHWALFLLAALAPVHWAQAQSEPPPLSAYGELPGVEDVALSPSGRRIAMLATVKAVRLLIVMNDEQEIENSIKVGALKIRGFDFIDEDRILLHTSTTEDLGFGFAQDKYEFYQAMILSIKGDGIDLVFGNERKLANATFGYHGIRIVEGTPTAFFGAIEYTKSGNGRYVFDHGRPALYSVNLIENDSKRTDYSPSAGMDRDWLIDEKGEVLAKLDLQKDSGRWTIRSRDGEIARGQNRDRGAYLIAMGQTGDTIIYQAFDEVEQATKWYEVPVDGSTDPVEVFADIDIARIFTEPRTGRLIGYMKDGDEREPVFFDETFTKKVRMIRKAFSQFNNRLADWTEDFGHAIVLTDGNGDSGTYYKVDVTALRAEPFGFERPAIYPELVGPVSTFEYTASDGLEMDGILTVPPAVEAKDLPLVMLPHGGPHSHDKEGFDWWAQAFASRGYAVFQPNFRGSTNRDEAFIQAGYGQWGGKMQSDISDGLVALAEQGIVDPARACIVGASYGGYAALAGVTLQQGLYRCAVSVAGVADVSLMSRIERRENSSKVRERSFERQLGPKSNFKTISPRYHAEKADAPILLIHGVDDTVVHFQQSEKMADALRDAGKPYEFLKLDGEDHWLSLAKTRKAMLEATVAFVEKHNPPD